MAKKTITVVPAEKIIGTLPSKGGTSGSDTPSFKDSKGRPVGFVSGGGGGGGSSSPAPAPEPKPEPKTDVQIVAERAEAARQARTIAAQLGEDISTPTREKAFLNKLLNGGGSSSEKSFTFTPMVEGQPIPYGAINLPNTTANKTPTKSTSVSSTSFASNLRGYSAPTIVKEQVGTLTNPATGQVIAETEAYLIEPQKIGEAKKTKIVPSAVTPSGTIYNIPGYNPIKISKELSASDKPVNLSVKRVKDSIYGGYTNLNQKLKESISYPLIGSFEKGVEKVTGVQYDYESRQKNILESTDFLLAKGYSKPIAYGGAFISGAFSGELSNLKEKPLKSAVIYGASFGVGFAKNIAISGISKLSAGFGGTTRAAIFGAEAVAGTVYGAGVLTKTISAQNVAEAGSIFGQSVGDAAIFGAGYSRGYKSGEQIKGYFSTRGRELIPLERLTTPEVISGKDRLLLTAKNRQLIDFKRARFGRELGEGPGAFHTTPTTFWKKGEIFPGAGTSELPGLYAATGISPHFAKIPGSKSSKFNTQAFLKDITAPGSSPGVAYLKPQSFRYSPFERANFLVGEQRFKFRFKKPAKPGVADVPLMKNEAEAILRPEAGKYLLESGKYYTVINNVRVPIDVFGFGGKGPTVSIPKGARTLASSGSYDLPLSSYYKFGYGKSLPFGLSSPRSSSRVSPSSSILKSYSSNVKSSTLSRVYGSSARSSISRSSISRSYGSSSSISSSRSSAPKSSRSSTSSILPGSSNPYGTILPKLKLKSVSKGKAERFIPDYIYQPSFTASILNIKAKKVPIAAGGLSLRPIVKGLKTLPKAPRRIKIF